MPASVRPALPLGAPNPSGYLRNAPLLARLMYRTSESPSGCWLWRGVTDRAGYGTIGLGGRGPSGKVHRVAYEELVGPIPAEMTIDHLCRVKNCVNPDHLEVVTLEENIRRRRDALRASGVCANGQHVMTPDNIMEKRGVQWCRECRKATWRAYHERRRTA